MKRRKQPWKTGEHVQKFLTGVRGAVPCRREQVDCMLRVLRAARQPVQRFLDVGSGDGVLAAAILGRWPEARGVLVDFSKPMIERAREALSAYRDQLTFVLADFSEPGWLDQVPPQPSVDAVVSGFAIHHQPDKRKRALYVEVFDILAPGGAFINMEHVASATPWVESIWQEMLTDAVCAHLKRSGNPKTPEEVKQEYVLQGDSHANLLAPVETQCQWLREIGYQDVDCYFKVLELAVFGGRRPS